MLFGLRRRVQYESSRLESTKLDAILQLVLLLQNVNNLFLCDWSNKINLDHFNRQYRLHTDFYRAINHYTVASIESIALFVMLTSQILYLHFDCCKHDIMTNLLKLETKMMKFSSNFLDVEQDIHSTYSYQIQCFIFKKVFQSLKTFLPDKSRLWWTQSENLINLGDKIFSLVSVNHKCLLHEGKNTSSIS